MKRRNAESGKMRRPLKRTKITDGMYGNSLLYLKFVMLWATVVMADYMLEFRFEFLWPFWMMLRSVYDSFKYQGLAFSVFFICIALTSDMICFFFIPVQWIFFAASTYVWVQYVWYTATDKGVCLPTVALCCALVYIEGALRGGERGGGLGGGGLELCRPLAAHCVGYPVVTLGFGVKSYVGYRMRLRRQRHVRVQNELYYQIMRESLPESALEQNQTSTKEGDKGVTIGNGSVEKTDIEHKHMNGNAVHATKSKKSEKDKSRAEPNGSCNHEHSSIQINSKIEKNIHSHCSSTTLMNGSVGGVLHDVSADRCDEDRRHRSPEVSEYTQHEKTKGSTKSSSKCDKKEITSPKEERRKNRNKDKDKDKEVIDSNKSTEHTKEQIIIKEIEPAKDNTKSSKESNSNKDKERDREREREQREARECAEELRKTRVELASARASEAEARRALAAAAAAERQRRADHQQLKQAHDDLQQKLSAWRGTERAALERRLGEERRARTTVEQQLQRAQQQNRQRKTGECDNDWCRARRTNCDAETTGLRRELQRTRERVTQLQRDVTAATTQIRTLEARQEENGSPRLTSALQALQERAGHLERSLSAETRVKLDLFSALGEAKRQLQIREGLIAKQDKEIEELKAQMLAVMPPDSFMNPVSGTVSKLRLSDGSPLDPNASVYTPKQLCSDA